MTEKRFDKDLIAILYATVLTILALIYSFSQVPSPSEQQKFDMDQIRVVDLGKISREIDRYYSGKLLLPTTLEELKQFTSQDQYTSTVLNINDPVTKQYYNYSVTGSNTYQICADFATSNTNLDERLKYYSKNYEYNDFKSSFVHGTGYVCFDKSVMRNFDQIEPQPSYEPYSTPSAYIQQSENPSAVPTPLQ